jgi:hypothetical protein
MFRYIAYSGYSGLTLHIGDRHTLQAIKQNPCMEQAAKGYPQKIAMM